MRKTYCCLKTQKLNWKNQILLQRSIKLKVKKHKNLKLTNVITKKKLFKINHNNYHINTI